MIANSELEALVLDLTIVGVNLAVTSRWTQLAIEEQVLGVLDEVVEGDVPIIEECKVDTEVGHLGGFPLEVAVLQRHVETDVTMTVAPVTRDTL